MNRRIKQVCALFAGSVLLVACGGPRPRPGPHGRPVPVEMEPMVVEVGAGGVEAYDAQQLFEEGQAAAARHDNAACEASYGKLLERFPKSRYAHSTLYNRGLCLELLKRYNEAAYHFRRHAQLATTLSDRRDGEVRLGYNLVEGGDYPTAVALYTELLKADDLGPADRGECHLRRGIARFHLKKHGLAERDLKQAMGFVKVAYEDDMRGIDLFAEAHYRRGEIYQYLSHGVQLALPVASMKAELAEKMRFFRQSQSSYVDALNVQHGYWATAAGLRLGELYEQFYSDVLQAQVPESFSEDDKRFYFKELRHQLTPLLKESVSIYEKNITMGQRLGAKNEWVRETEARLQRLRTLIETNQREHMEDSEAAPEVSKKGALKGARS